MTAPHASSRRPFLVLSAALLLLVTAAAATAPVVPDEEVRIAYHVTVTAEQLPLLPRFLLRIYHPANLYLVDYAPPIDPARHAAKFSKPNVYHRAADPYTEHGVSEVINVLDGMAYFLNREAHLQQSRSFEYFTHCSPEEYPVIKPALTRRVFAFDHRDYPPPNYFHFTHETAWPLFSDEIDRFYMDLALSFNHSLDLSKGLLRTSMSHPDKKRRIFNLPRSDKFFVVNHEYVKLAVDSPLSKRILMILSDTSHVYQHFFAALAHNTKDPIGRIVRTTSLRCRDAKALEVEAHQLSANYRPLPPSMEALWNTHTPCIFTGPFDITHPTNMFDQIDQEFLIPPGTQGKPPGPGFHDRVIKLLNQMHE